MDKRAKIIVIGRVQRSGYRLMVDRIAFGLGLKGTVENLPDDNVEIICEGPEELLDEFSRRVQIHKFPVRVDSIRVEKSAATGEFREFVRLPDDLRSSSPRRARLACGPDDRLDGDPNWKLDLGIITLQDLSEKQDLTLGGIQAVDSHITGMDQNIGGHLEKLEGKQDATIEAVKAISSDLKAVDSNIQSMDQHIRSMDQNIGGHFDRLDKKYDAFGSSLSQVATDIHEMKSDVRKAVSPSTRSEARS